ncbi:MAG TPA: FAD-dependent oxidoreductase [Thermoanaerobaculia bacterium]|jgi:D-amino-acid oxidase
MRVGVVGAGVSGLTCAVVLSEAGVDVSVYAREIEGEVSPVAAAIWYPYHIAGEDVARWSQQSYEKFEELARLPGTGVSMVDFAMAGEGTLHVPLIETPIYLPWLRRNLRIEQRAIGDFAEVEADVVVNCAGLGAAELCDDRTLIPGRGVILKTANPGIVRHMARVDGETLTYVLTRTDDIVLGGTDDHVASRDVPPELAEAIYARCAAVEPRLPREFTSHVGFRPERPEVRLEREGKVIHNYGHGGGGFTVSWGCAYDVLALYRQVIS